MIYMRLTGKYKMKANTVGTHIVAFLRCTVVSNSVSLSEPWISQGQGSPSWGKEYLVCEFSKCLLDKRTTRTLSKIFPTTHLQICQYISFTSQENAWLSLLGRRLHNLVGFNDLLFKKKELIDTTIFEVYCPAIIVLEKILIRGLWRWITTWIKLRLLMAQIYYHQKSKMLFTCIFEIC